MSFQYMIWTLAMDSASHCFADAALHDRIRLNVPHVGEEFDQPVDDCRVAGLHHPARLLGRRSDGLIPRDGLVFARVGAAPFPLDVRLTVGFDLFESSARFGVT